MHSKSYPAVTSRVSCMWTAEGWGVFLREWGNGRRIAESLSLFDGWQQSSRILQKRKHRMPHPSAALPTHTHTHSLTYHAHHTHNTQYHAPTTTQPHPSTTNPKTTKSTPLSPPRSPKKRKNILHTPSRFRPTEGKMHNLQTPQWSWNHTNVLRPKFIRSIAHKNKMDSY